MGGTGLSRHGPCHWIPLAASWGELTKNGEPPGLPGPKSSIDRAPGSLRGRDDHASTVGETFPPAQSAFARAGGFMAPPKHEQPLILSGTGALRGVNKKQAEGPL